MVVVDDDDTMVVDASTMFQYYKTLKQTLYIISTNEMFRMCNIQINYNYIYVCVLQIKIQLIY